MPICIIIIYLSHKRKVNLRMNLIVKWQSELMLNYNIKAEESPSTRLLCSLKLGEHLIIWAYFTRRVQINLSRNRRRPQAALLIFKIILQCIKEFPLKSIRYRFRNHLNSSTTAGSTGCWRWRSTLTAAAAVNFF